MPSHTVSEGISFRQMEVNYSFHKRNDEALKEKKSTIIIGRYGKGSSADI